MKILTIIWVLILLACMLEALFCTKFEDDREEDRETRIYNESFYVNQEDRIE